METISKLPVRILTGLLGDYGVHHIVVSSGSRCAPLTVAFNRAGCFCLHTVIDERSAGFVALGMAIALGEPVAMVCTSGTAPLNYAPALAEAYYRRVPLIAVTADRPQWWVGQREGQTIRQAGALDAVVRCSVDIPCSEDADSLRQTNRQINMALSEAMGRIPGPVHINVRLDAPLTAVAPADLQPIWRRIVRVQGKLAVPADICLPVADPAGVLVLVGDNSFDAATLDTFKALAAKPGVVVLAEAQANIPGAWRPAWFEEAFANASFPVPDIVVSLGGALVSNALKQWLRSIGVPHVSIGYDDEPVDTFGSLVMSLDVSPEVGLSWLMAQLQSCAGDSYKERCAALSQPKAGQWPCMSAIAGRFRSGTVHISNGTAIRAAQHVAWADGVRIECNRGVSGIEGSTSTAIGAAMLSSAPTLLVSGDMSAAYDVGAFALKDIPPTFRMVVLDNGGGDIFRRIPTTSGLAELDELFVMPPRLPLRELAMAYGFRYFEYCPAEESFPDEFFAPSGTPAILRAILR